MPEGYLRGAERARRQGRGAHPPVALAEPRPLDDRRSRSPRLSHRRQGRARSGSNRSRPRCSSLATAPPPPPPRVAGREGEASTGRSSSTPISTTSRWPSRRVRKARLRNLPPVLSHPGRHRRGGPPGFRAQLARMRFGGADLRQRAADLGAQPDHALQQAQAGAYARPPASSSCSIARRSRSRRSASIAARVEEIDCARAVRPK